MRCQAWFPDALVLLDGAHALGQVPIELGQLEQAGVDAYVSRRKNWPGSQGHAPNLDSGLNISQVLPFE